MQKLGPGLVVGGVLLLIAACCVFFIAVPKIIDTKVKEETQLQTNSSTYVKWANAEVPIYLKLTFFNITNPDAVEKNETLVVQEVGPYVWEEDRQKIILDIDEEEDTISYKEHIHYYFRRDLSVGDQTDAINVINFPLITMSTILKKTLGGFLGNLLVQPLFNEKNDEKFVRNVRVQDVMFDGIPINDWYKTILKLASLVGPPPEEFSGGAFAFYKTKNGSHDGVYKIKSGKKDHTTFGSILTWDDKKELDWWTNSSLPSYEQQYCNKINGTDGSLFPPFVDKERILRIFVLDICRSIYLTFNKEMEYRGVKGYQFTIPPKMFEHPDRNEDNRCFCTDPQGGLQNRCAGGVIRIFSCKSDAPLIISNPHFLDADQEFIDGVKGLKPDPEIHGTQIEVEPKSGLLLRARKRIQFNVELQPLEGIPQFKDFATKGVVIPMFWAEEEAAISEEDTDELKDKLMKPVKIVNITQWVVIAVLALVVLGGGYVTFRTGG